MEPLTHFLYGACLGRAGFNRKTALATATMTLAAEAPDIDILAYFNGPVFGFAHHRGITHTFLGTPFIAAAVVAFMYLLWWAWLCKRKRWQGRSPRWGWLFLCAWIAALSHLLLDFSNSYGLRPFMPASYKWYSWDIVFIIEPLLYLVLIGGLVLPSLFRLITEEVSSRRERMPGRAGAIAALILVVAVWGVRDYYHRRAVAILDSRLYHGAEPLRVSAVPYMLSPFRWYGIVETEAFFEQVEVDALAAEVDPQGRSQTRFKPEETEVTRAAKSTDLGRVYLDWAAYPITETEPQADGGYIVRFRDLRFMYPDQRRSALGAYVVLDKNLRPMAEAMGTGRARILTQQPPD